MGAITDAIATTWRDYVTDGVPASGENEPGKSEIRAIGPIIEAAIGAAVLGGVAVTKDTRAHLNADLAWAADSVALVYADPTDANNDLYIKVGATGTGSWTLTTILHDAFEPQIAKAQAWAEGTEPDGPGSYSAREYSEQSATTAAAVDDALTDAEALVDEVRAVIPKTYPVAIPDYEVIEIILDDDDVLRIISTIGDAGALTYETPQSPDVVLQAGLRAALGADAIFITPDFYPPEVDIHVDDADAVRVSYAHTVDGRVLQFSDNAAEADTFLFDYDPDFITTGVHGRWRVVVPSPVPGSPYHVEHVSYCSTDALALGTWRRVSSNKVLLLDAATVSTSIVEEYSGGGYSGFGPWSQSADATGHAYDPTGSGGIVYTTAPFNFQGGGDIHKNNYPLLFRLWIDEVEHLDNAQPFTGAIRKLRNEYVYKVLESRNPPLASSDNGFVHCYEEITVTNAEQLQHGCRAIFQKQWTGSGYFPKESFNGQWELLDRDHPHTAGGVSTVTERIDLSTYNSSAYPTGDNLVPGVSRTVYSLSGGDLVIMTVSAPNTYTAANATWGPPTLNPFDLLDIKGATGPQADPFTTYWNYGGPATFAAFSGTVGRAVAGDIWARDSQIMYYPR